MQPTPFTPWVWRDPSIGAAPRPGDADDVQEGVPSGVDLTGFKVEATDGHIGSIDQASYDIGSAFLVVDTGPWIFGRKVLLPAGTVQTVDHAEEKVYVDRTKEQIKGSPEYDEDTFDSHEYRESVGEYYSSSYRDYPH